MRNLLIFLLALVLSFNCYARDTTLLDSGWRFQLADPANAEQPSFDDSAWQTVSIPHNWGWEDAQAGRNYHRGPGWYRRELNFGAPQTGKRYYLKFDAASTVADVYLNGR